MTNEAFSEVRSKLPLHIYDILAHSEEKFPDKALFKYARGGQECEISYRGFRELVDALAAAITADGFFGKHIALVGEKSPEWLAVYFAVIRSGGTIVPLDKDISAEQMPGFIEFGDCEAIFCTEKYRKYFPLEDSRLRNIKRMVIIGNQLPAESIIAEADDSFNANELTASFSSYVYYGAVQINETPEYEAHNHDIDRMALLLYTSGTTGTSKGVMLSERNVTSCVVGAVEYVDIGEKDVLLSILPLHHTYEMAAGILGPILAGSTICINDSLISILGDLKKYQPTIMAAVPLVIASMNKKIESQLAKLNKEKAAAIGRVMAKSLKTVGIDVRRAIFKDIHAVFGGNLRLMCSGGAALNPELVDKFETYGITIKQGYGITECAPVIGIIPKWASNPPSCGLLLGHLQILIDKETPQDTTGEICVKGDNVMLGYYKNPEATDAVLTKSGWFSTGDVGYVDNKNYIYITGRKKNVIVLENGKNVFPEEIEEYLENIPLINECMVTTRQTDDGVTRLTALIYPDYDALKANGTDTKEEVMEYFKKKIASLNKTLPTFKQIKNIEIRTAAFPKTSTQKIQRHKVEKESD